MPKLIDYPRASFARVLDMADAIDYLGGTCTVQTCAEKMGVKVSGAFTALIGAAKKHGLVESDKSLLKTTPLFRSIKLAYDDKEKLLNLRDAFLSAPLYRKIYERFLGKELPIKMLDKLMIREFDVDEESAQRVMNYFLEGARNYEILVDNKIVDLNTASNSSSGIEQTEYEGENVIRSYNETLRNPIVRDDTEQEFYSAPNNIPSSSVLIDSYTIHIYGPGINSKLTISEEDDFLILEAMIAKLKKKFKS